MEETLAMNPPSPLETIKELATAVSVQASASNRTWLALLTVAAATLLPRASTAGPSNGLELPFALGQVDPTWFYIVLFLMLVVLTIAFSAAHAQQVRAEKLAHGIIVSMRAEIMGMDPRELYDMLRLPSLNRVAALAQSIRGKYQFFRNSAQCPHWLRILSTIYYGFLKLSSMIVYYGLPALALWEAYGRTLEAGMPPWPATIGGGIAGVTLFQVLTQDLLYSVGVIRIIGSVTSSSKPR
jgi:hypothetical protein